MPLLLAAILICAGMGLRVAWMNQSALWCDEAESSINALTILETGVPGWKYLGLPVFENTLTEPWDDHPEYEFRDSTYSAKGVVVYHGWLPIYAIAASQWLCGLRPDRVHSPPVVLHGPGATDWRTTAPRLPALLFSLICMLVIYRIGCELGGPAAGVAALAFMALNARTVDFGIQARYYSLTLAMNAVAAWYLLQVIRRGRWRDFAGLGIASGLLFHTHLFSTVVFAVVAAAATPWIVRRPSWFAKSALGGFLAVLLVVPWILLTGFLDTASSVPKVFELFQSPRDALFYMTDRPASALVLAAAAAVILAALLGWKRLPEAFIRGVRTHAPAYLLLLVWMLAGYAAFHVIVPAASFFYERLTLSLWTPFVLAVSLFLSDLLRVLRPQLAAPLALAVVLLFLGSRNRLALFEETSILQRRHATAALTATLQDMKFPAGTRFFATPNDHLNHTYYTGLPVQSVAPVRRSFFEKYPGLVVFIETQMDAFFPADEDLAAVFAEQGWPLHPDRVWEIKQMVWNWKTLGELAQRELATSPPEDLPDWLQPVAEQTRAEYENWRDEYIESLRSSPILRDLPASSVKDIWLGFFYRFVDPASRLGERSNIFQRIQGVEVVLVPTASKVIFLSPNPVRTPPEPE